MAQSPELPSGAVYVYGPDGNIMWDGRLEAPGRHADADGTVWQIAAEGPAAHAEDLIKPVIHVDRSVDRPVRRSADRRR